MMEKDSALLQAFQRVLVLCAHTDDELGCAGLIMRLVEAGCYVRYVALSRCEESVPSPYPKDILEKECRECTAELGIEPEMVDIWNYRVRHFPSVRQEILEDFVKLNHEFRPDLVLLPSSFDTHQDHAVVAAEGFRAFKSCSIFGYELAQNLITFSNTAFVALTDRLMEKKNAALSLYKSQAFRNYTSDDFIRSLARVRGGQANVVYAEAYEVIRLIIV